MIETLKKSALVTGAMLLSFVALAGPIPFTSAQFPVWLDSQTVTVSASSNANEVILYQQPVPLFVVGNNGFMRFTAFVGSPDAAAATVTHSVRFYLGGTNGTLGGSWTPTGATPLFTNTFTTTLGQPIQEWLLPQGGGVTNRAFSSTTTNSFVSGDYGRIVTVGTQTNGLLLTVTGQAGGTGGSTNVINLDAFIFEVFQKP